MVPGRSRGRRVLPRPCKATHRMRHAWDATSSRRRLRIRRRSPARASVPRASWLRGRAWPGSWGIRVWSAGGGRCRRNPRRRVCAASVRCRRCPRRSSGLRRTGRRVFRRFSPAEEASDRSSNRRMRAPSGCIRPVRAAAGSSARSACGSASRPAAGSIDFGTDRRRVLRSAPESCSSGYTCLR